MGLSISSPGATTIGDDSNNNNSSDLKRANTSTKLVDQTKNRVQNSERTKRPRSSTLPSLNALFSNRFSRRFERTPSSPPSIPTLADEPSSQQQQLQSSSNNNSSSSIDSNGDDNFKETKVVTMGVDDDGNKTVNAYTIIRTLGKGSFGKVKLCMDSNNKAFVCIYILFIIIVLTQVVGN
jgi:hypothetical protein